MFALVSVCAYILDLIRFKNKVTRINFVAGVAAATAALLAVAIAIVVFLWLIIRRLFAMTGWKSGEQLVAAVGMRK